MPVRHNAGMAGNWADLAAVGISAGALIVSGMAWWQAKRAADAAKDSARAAERTADIESARFEVEHPGVGFAFQEVGGMLRLQNIGRDAATGIQVTMPDGQEVAFVARLDPQEISRESFRVQATWGTGTITSLLVDCDGLAAPTVVPITSPRSPRQIPRRIR